MMKQKRDSLVTLITGANRGLGWEIGKQLCSSDHRVYLGTRDASLHGLAISEEESLQNAYWLFIDITSVESLERANQHLLEKEGKLDTLINNAAINIDPNLPITEVDLPTLQKTFDTNVFAQIKTVQIFLPLLRKSPQARILNLSSGCGQFTGMPEHLPAYSLSKLAVHGMTLMFARKLEAEGIAVNSVCPGWARTKMGGEEAPLSAAEGAEGITWLARDADPLLTGKFFRDKKEVLW